MDDKTSLRTRCIKFLSRLKQDAMLRQGSPVDDLIAFVVSENGRQAYASLDASLPLCLYFATEADRDEFIDAFQEAKPNAVSRRMP